MTLNLSSNKTVFSYNSPSIMLHKALLHFLEERIACSHNSDRKSTDTALETCPVKLFIR